MHINKLTDISLCAVDFPPGNPETPPKSYFSHIKLPPYAIPPVYCIQQLAPCAINVRHLAVRAAIKSLSGREEDGTLFCLRLIEGITITCTTHCKD